MAIPRPEFYAYFGHHKCGTQWVHRILNAICAQTGLVYAYLVQPHSFDHNLAEYVRSRKLNFVSYVTADMRYLGNLDQARGFHLIRDPRDICVSAYFSHLYSHPPTPEFPDLQDHRQRLMRLTKDEGLILEMRLLNGVFQHMYNWDYSSPNLLEIKMEKLIQDPYGTFLDVFRFLWLLDESSFYLKKQIRLVARDVQQRLHLKSRGLIAKPSSLQRVPVTILLNQVYENRFSKLADGRQKGHEDVHSHYRKGVAGDWVNHFKPEHVASFKREYADLLLKLGYETTNDW